MAKRFKYIDDHAFIDTANKAEIVIRGLRYAVLYQDIDIYPQITYLEVFF